ncbi:MAG: transglutaminase domain-containing protein [Thermodesulfobacteriota bacterium]
MFHGLRVVLVVVLALGAGSCALRAPDPYAGPAGWADGYPDGSERRAAARFLAENLPPGDAADLDPAALAEHLEYAFLAREAMPWGRQVPFDLFLRYVVPHRVTQERLQPWRKQLFETLVPLLAGVEDIRAAALAVNRWCFSMAGFSTTARWDQGPADTWTRGLGRCEELTILFVAAARAVGIPARTCLTPYWRHSDDNHLWAEFWDGAGWRYLGSGEPESLPGLAWFSPHLPKAVLFLAGAYGGLRPGEVTDAPAYAEGPGFLLLNRTAAYAPTGRLRAEVAGPDGRPADNATAFVHVYNYGRYAPVARLACGPDGAGELEAGGGDLLVCAARDGKADCAPARVEPGRTTAVRLVLDGRRLPEGERRMDYAEDPDRSAAAAAAFAQVEAAAAPVRAALEAERKARLESFAALAGRAAGGPDTPLAKALAEAGANVPELLRGLDLAAARGREDFEAAAAMVLGMPSKDRAVASGPRLAAEARLALDARAGLRARGLLDYDDEVFVRGVLPGRILFEQFSHWREGLAARVAGWAGQARDLRSLVRRVNRLLAGMSRIAPRGRGVLMTPAQALAAGGWQHPDELLVLGGALLRSLGVPARLHPDRNWLEFFDGAAWLPLYPGQPGDLGDTRATAEAAAFYGPHARVEVRFRRGGEPLSGEEAQYYRDFAVSQLLDPGFFAVLEDPGLSWEEGAAVLDLPAGEYLLTCGARGGSGRPLVRSRVLDLAPGQAVSLEMSLDPGD